MTKRNTRKTDKKSNAKSKAASSEEKSHVLPAAQQAMVNQLLLTSYFFDRGFAIRETVQQRTSRWLWPMLAQVRPDPTGFLNQLVKPAFQMELFRQIAQAEWPLVGEAVLLNRPADVQAVLEAELADVCAGQEQIDSMQLFQPEGLAPTRCPGTYARRRTANKRLLEDEQRVHSEAAQYLAALRSEVDCLDPASGILRWGDIDCVTRELALAVVWGQKDHSLRTRLDELMRQANMRGTVVLLQRLFAMSGVPDDRLDAAVLNLARSFPRDMRQRVGVLLADGGAAQTAACQQHQEWIRDRLAAAPPGALAAGLHQAVQAGELTSEEAPDQLTHWMFATRGTVAVHTIYALAFLAKDHALQERLAGQLVRDFGNPINLHAGIVAAEANDALQSLERLLLEAGRLFPAVPFLVRQRQPGGAPVGDLPEQFSNFMIHNVGNNRTQQFVGDAPESVRLARWCPRDAETPEIDGKGAIGATIFGGGTKRCPGMNLGLLLSSAFLGQLLMQYRVDSVRHQDPQQTPMDVVSVPDTYDQFGIELAVSQREGVTLS